MKKNRDSKPAYIILEDNRKMYKQKPKKTYTTFPSLQEFKKNIASLVGIAKAHKISICFLIQPSLYSENMTEDEKNSYFIIDNRDFYPDISSLYNGMKLYNGQIRIICREEDIEYIDLTDKIPKSLQYFYDHVHLTPKGARFAGETISAYLIDNWSRFEKDK